ncbi:MAG: DUF1206 domain-containing protein [Mycobacteriaceae bacterium]
MLHDVAASSPLRHFARAGLLAYALLHLVIAYLAVRLAWPGGREPSTSSAGALHTLARSTPGKALLLVLAVGLAGLAAWQAVEVLRHRNSVPEDNRDRLRAAAQLVKTVGTAVVYAYLAYSAVRVAFSRSADRSGGQQKTVRGVFALPAGQLLVLVGAAVVVGIGIYQVQKGARSGFDDEIDLDDMPQELRALTHRVIQLGFIGKGVALSLVGILLGWAAVTFDPGKASGLDGALRLVLAEPFGRWALFAVAAGFASFAVYCGVRAWHPVG